MIYCWLYLLLISSRGDKQKSSPYAIENSEESWNKDDKCYSDLYHLRKRILYAHWIRQHKNLDTII